MNGDICSRVWTIVALCCLEGLLLSTAGGGESTAADGTTTIQRIDIVHSTHTDIGFTDHPEVCRRQQARYLDIAIDAVLETRDAPPDGQFYWTAETTLAISDWWQRADAPRRRDLLDALATGRLELAALAMNQTPTLDASQWHTTLHWLPEDLWRRAHPRVAIQNDVNGFPRAGARALLDRGVEYLFMGINATNGGPPQRVPSAFWWQMEDGRRMFVWLGDHYARGFYYFHPQTWRRGPVPESTDTRYRPARPGDFFRADEDSVRAAHRHLLGQLRGLEASGYDYPTLVISVTNEWRMDNDPPFPGLADFVATWHRLDLKPAIHLSTAADALARLRQQVGDTLPVRTGEWPDWWANGAASGPREVAASRRAKRLRAAALSPVWGPVDPGTAAAADDISRTLCLFDEHTWGSSDSIAQPHSLDTWAQYNEKSRTAYLPMALAKLLLAQRARSAIYPREAGLYVTNPAPQAWSGWITLPASCLRGDVHSLASPDSDTPTPLIFEPGYQPFARPTGTDDLTISNTSETFPDNRPDQQVRFWVERLDGQSIRQLRFREQTVAAMPAAGGLDVVVDSLGWPESARWPSMDQPLFAAGSGDFLSVTPTEFAARWTFGDILSIADPAERERRRRSLKEEPAVATEPARVERNAHTTIYRQTLTHSRTKWLTRQIELWNDQPRARVTVRFHRTESELPEWFFVAFQLPTTGVLPQTSCGGLPFVPFEDQLPGTCRDYFAIDSWVRYTSAAGHWLWVTRDAPLVSFGDHQVLAHSTRPPDNPNRILVNVFNNIWFTNFVADSHGAFEFQFDLAWQPADSGDSATNGMDPAAQAATLLAEPQVVINPELREDPKFMNRLHRP